MMNRHAVRATRGPARRARRVALVGFAALLAAAGWPVAPPALAAQEPASVEVTLRLRDSDTNAPLMGVLIELSDHARRYVTGVDGTVTVAAAPGTYVVTARKGGYGTLTDELVVAAAAAEVALELKRLEEVEPGHPATLLVRVREAGTGNAIEGAAVSLAGAGTRPTGRSGNAQFITMSGPARITVEMIGYATRTEPVSVHHEGATVVTVALAVEAVVLPPIEVEVRSRFLEANGVYRRIDRGVVMRLVTREDIDKFPVSFLSDAFVSVPGVTVDRREMGATKLMGPARGDPDGCELTVFVDGLASELNIDDFPPEMVEMAEVYWGLRTPIQYRGVNQSNCGVVLLWTRRGGG